MNEILDDMALQITCARYPYTGGGNRVMPDGTIKTMKEVYDGLSEEEKHWRHQEAYAAWMVLSRYPLMDIMNRSWQEYINEK